MNKRIDNQRPHFVPTHEKALPKPGSCMAWRVERTKNFDRWWKKEGVHDRNFEFHAHTLARFQNVALPHNRQTQIFKNSNFECWVIRLPDKMKQQGKSGGFRVVLVLGLQEQILWLEGIFRRSHLSYKGSSGKYDRAYEELIQTLTREFVEKGNSGR